jgi:hypothetical protein
MAYAADQPHLVGAAASIGISYGKSTGQVLRGHLTYFHEHGHDLAATGMYEDRGGASS